MSVAEAGTAGPRYVPRTQARRRTGSRRLDPSRLGEHLDLLYRAARGMCRSREEAEDLVQEALVRVLTRPRFLQSDDDVGYLLRVLRNTFISRRRLAQRRPEFPVSHDELAFVEDVSAARPETGLDHSELYQAIASLPDAFRDALIAVDLMGLSYGEAARALRVREATITTRLYRGRQRVVHMLKTESGITPVARTTTPSRPSGT